MDNTLVLVMGPQAAGKTTYVDRFLTNHPDYTLVSSDLYWPRNDLGKRYWIDREGHVHDWGSVPIDPDILQNAYRWAYYEFIAALMNKKNIIYEATFIAPNDRKRVLSDAAEENYYIRGVFLNVSLLKCAQRNEERHDRVPDIILARTYARINLPTFEEGFDSLVIL